MYGVSNFFWSYSWPGPFADHDAAMLADDVFDDRLLTPDMGRTALIADEGQADLLEVPSPSLQHLHQALAHQRRNRYSSRLLASGEGEAGLPRIRDPGDRWVGVAGRDLLHAGQPGVPGREQISQDQPLFRDSVHLHGDFGDHAQPTLGAQDHLADARAGGGVGEWPYDEHLAWHDSPEASGDVSDVAVLVRLHARGPGCHPAAERAVGESCPGSDRESSRARPAAARRL